MQYIADLHLHSRYSRATSPELNIEGLYKGAKIKGIDLIGTGDFTHPAYIKEIEKELVPLGGGFYDFKRKNKISSVKVKNFKDPKFLITAEIANIYKKHGKARRIHTCVFAPGIEEAKELNRRLGKIGNIKSDGRPILGLDVEEMAKIIWEVSEDFIIIPAHAWTPWFAIFGSKSGFDSIEECYGELSKKIFAIETGLSSDVKMNQRVSALDNISFVSNSDAHSLSNLGREATVFELESLSIQNIAKALDKKKQNKKSKNHISYTIEFYPEEGKYHYDGHSACKFVCDPKETKRLKGVCPKCKKLLTVGVLSRVEELADRDKEKDSGNYKYIVPLAEIIADAFGKKKQSKIVKEIYDFLILNIADEFSILLKSSVKEIEKFAGKEIAQGVLKVRTGQITAKPGYDGEYGIISVFSEEEKINSKDFQQKMF